MNLIRGYKSADLESKMLDCHNDIPVNYDVV